MNDLPEEQTTPAPRTGFLPPEKVRAISFYVVSLCVLMGSFVCILAIWNDQMEDVFWRLLATIAVVAFGTLVFSWVNVIFGEKVHQHQSSSEASH